MIEGFDPVPDPESICPKGQGHEWIEVYCNKHVQILRCRKRKRDSVGYFFNPDKEEPK